MTIAQVSARLGLSADTLRYYERIGIIPPVGRAASGIRNYNENDCRWIELAKCMRSAGLRVESIARYVALFRQGPGTSDERLELLLAQRHQLVDKISELQGTLTRLNLKIERYESKSIADEL